MLGLRRSGRKKGKEEIDTGKDGKGTSGNEYVYLLCKSCPC